MPPQTPTNVNPGALVGLVITLLVLVALVLHWLLMRVRQGNLREGLRGLGQILRKEAPVLSAMFQGAAPTPTTAPAPAYDHYNTLYQFVVQEAQRQTDDTPKADTPEEGASESESTPAAIVIDEPEAAEETPVIGGDLDPVVLPIEPTPAVVVAQDEAFVAPKNVTAMPIVLSSLHPRRRGHTAVAGRQGDGKTSTMNTLLVSDILAGAQCIVCSTHFTYYHYEDQQIDLRPLRDHFDARFTPADILDAMQAACDEIEARIPKYRNNEDVGHDIVLYFGEWDTSIQRTLGDEATKRLLQILDEGRKTRVWVGYIEVHGAQAKRFGGDGALRAAFTTRFAGNVDLLSWKVFVGEDTPRQPVPIGSWMTSNGLVQVTRPTLERINHIASTITPNHYRPLHAKTPPQQQASVIAHIGVEDMPVATAPDFVVNGLNNPATNRETGATLFQGLNSVFPALESGIAQPVSVPKSETETKNVVVTPAETVFIMQLLAAGTAPSMVARQLPDYDSRDYQTYKAKVDLIAALMKKDQVAA